MRMPPKPAPEPPLPITWAYIELTCTNCGENWSFTAPQPQQGTEAVEFYCPRCGSLRSHTTWATHHA